MPINAAIGASALGLLIGYVVLQYNLAKNNPAAVIVPTIDDIPDISNKKALLMVVGGLIGLALGAELLIRGSITTARIFHVPDSIIGLTIIALGTSLPELTTCIIAALKKQSDVIIGNLIGSNVFNLMMILGSMGLIKSYDIRQSDAAMLSQDVYIMGGVTVVFVILLTIFKKLPRMVGVVFAAMYFAYMIFLTLQTVQGS